jgi:hypothetical protein
MSVRPPADDDLDDEPDTVAFGIAALDARLDSAEIDFPADAGAVRTAVGDEEVPYNASGSTMTVATALDRANAEHFENEQDLLNALHPVFEQARESNRTGLLGRLRSFVPF